MRALWAVYKREVSLFFRSSIAYAIAFGLLLFLGFLFTGNVTGIVQFNQTGQASIPADTLVIQILDVLTFLLFIIGPLLTMRLLSEEAREGTLEVLMTLPMGDWTFVVGKWLAAWTFYTVVLLLTLVYMLLLSTIGVPDVGSLVVAYFGTWLYGGAVLAVAMIWSAITEDQIVAAFLSAASVLVLYLIGGAAQFTTNQTAANIFRELGLQTHFSETMLQGILRGEDVAYFVLLMVAALFITTTIVGTRRWRAN
jgi:ABC-2 type transport system permease protein